MKTVMKAMKMSELTEDMKTGSGCEDMKTAIEAIKV
jgi:hypothetical protein